MSEIAKYSRTMHLPWSPGVGRDDRIIDHLNCLIGHWVVISEKLDGSNVCLGREYLFARSHNGLPTHSSFDWLKAKYKGELQYMISEDISVYCEYVYALHSIPYKDLPNYLFVIAVKDEKRDMWYSWEHVEQVAWGLGLPTAPFLGLYKVETVAELERLTVSLAQQPGLFGPREGIVVRYADYFVAEEFSTAVAKWVRANHVQTDEHWTAGPVVKQELKNDT